MSGFSTRLKKVKYEVTIFLVLLRLPRMKPHIPTLVLIVLFASSCKKDVTENPSVAEFKNAFSQTGNQVANRLIAVADGIIIIGTSTIGGESHLQLVKTDFNGNELWTKELSSETTGFGIRPTSDGNLILIGTKTLSTDNQDAFLAKTDLNGNVIWEKTFGDIMVEQAKDVIELSHGGYVFVGVTQSMGPGVAALYVVRTDADGNEVWSKEFGGSGLDSGSELVQTSTIEIKLLGFTHSFGAGDRDIYLQTISADGDSLASFTYGGAGYEESQAIALTDDGGTIMCNHSASEDPTHKLWATKLDADNQVVWQQEFGGLTEHEGGEGALADSQGNYVFIGRTNSFGNDEQVYFIKTNANGNVLEELNFGEVGDQRGNDIIEYNGSYYICGTSTVNGDSDVLLIKRPM